MFHDPATGQGMVAQEDGRARADAAEAELVAGRARVREPEELLRRQDPANPDARGWGTPSCGCLPLSASSPLPLPLLLFLLSLLTSYASSA